MVCATTPEAFSSVSGARIVEGAIVFCKMPPNILMQTLA